MDQALHWRLVYSALGARAMRPLVYMCVLGVLAVCRAEHAVDAVYEGMTCTPCGTTEFCQAGKRAACPVHSANLEGLGTVQDCVCNNGYRQDDDGGAAHTCAAGTPPHYYIRGILSECPTNKETTVNLAHHISQCRCVPGYVVLLESCKRCGTDKYMDEYGQAECKDCPTRTTTTEFPVTRVRDCTCVQFSRELSPIAPDDLTARTCVCNEGYAAGASWAPCVACLPGTYKTTAGDEVCNNCPGGSHQPASGATVCIACNAHSAPPIHNAQPDLTVCVCNAGFTLATPLATAANPACVGCAANTYKTSAGAHVCSGCGANAASPNASTSPAGCLCNQGFAGHSASTGPAVCSACAAGTYKETVANVQCVLCPANMYSPSQSDAVGDCFCNAGYTPHADGACAACVPGTFKPLAGSALCEDCAADTYNPLYAQTVCRACYADAQSVQASTSQGQCQCNTGYALRYPDSDACTACVAGKYADELGQAQCKLCPTDSYTDQEASAACQPCGLNANAAQGSALCNCNLGHRCNGACVNKGLCTPCGSDTFNDEGLSQEQCKSCQSFSASAVGSDERADCKCNAGYSVDSLSCVACAAGKAGAGVHAATCTVCEGSHFSTGPAQLACQQCATDSVSDALTDGNGGQGCLCNRGFTAKTRDGQGGALANGDGSMSCVKCAAHQYKSTVDNNNCSQCNSDAASDEGSVALSDCQCNKGFEKPATAVSARLLLSEAGAGCTMCASGHYSDRISDDACVECSPARQYTTEFPGSDDELDCVCAPGFREVTALSYAVNSVGCTECDGNRWRDTYSRDECEPCRQHSRRTALSDASAEISCECGPGYTTVNASVRLPVCSACAAGLYKPAIGYEDCEACPANTFSKPGASECRACVAGKEGTDGNTGQQQCQCLAGFTAAGGACVSCAAGSFKLEFGDQQCSSCTACDAQTEAQTLPCRANQDRQCVSCQNNSAQSTPPSADHCSCNAGYGFDSALVECVACAPGTFKAHTINSLQCAACFADTFADTHGSVRCTSCGTCAGGTYQTRPCDLSQDVQCEPCTVCAAGLYAQGCDVAGTACVACGGLSDSTCVLCPAGSYCAGTDNTASACPFGAPSVPGAEMPQACGCASGDVFSNVGGERVCVACSGDGYCTHGMEFACPANSTIQFSNRTSIADCVCDDGFVEMAAADPTQPFTCERCVSETATCIGGQQLACAQHMISVEHECVCKAGFHRVSGACEPCASGSVCNNEVSTLCVGNTDTGGRQQQVRCVCKPGFAGTGCVLCSAGNYCPGGEAAASLPCRVNSVLAPGRATPCECDVGHASDNSDVLPCVQCASQVAFKATVGNAPCTPCRACDELVFQVEQCVPSTDAVCKACTECLAQHITVSFCQNRRDTICVACDVCSDTGFACCEGMFQRAPCEGLRQAVCSAITTDPGSCAVGEYLQAPALADGSGSADSICSACQFRDVGFHGKTLHVVISHGLQYDNRYSCKVQCIGHSRLVSETDHSLGCESCETGNVLLKDFLHATSCEFTCHTGYERVGDDCFLTHLPANTRSVAEASVAVTEYTRHDLASRFVVEHSDAGFFVVVVGPQAPEDCRRDHACFAALWRVSTLPQMGLLGDAADPDVVPLHATKLSATSLSFVVADSALASVTRVTLGETVLCVSLVDVTTWHVVTQVVFLRVQQLGNAMTYSTSVKQLLPLSMFEVDVALLYSKDTEHIFQVVTTAKAAALLMQVAVRGMTEVDPLALPECARRSTQSPPGSVMHYNSALALGPNDAASSVTFWESARDVQRLTALFHLARRKPSDNTLVMDVMDVAAVRDVRELRALCAPDLVTPRNTLFASASVWAVPGLGSAAVARLQRGGAPVASTGQLGRLVTFFAATESAGAVAMQLDTLLAAHVTTGSSSLDNAITERQETADFAQGTVDFAPEFRAWCLARPKECMFEYIHVFPGHDNFFELAACGADEKQQAVAWLRMNFGTVHDAGHVDALCALVREHAQRSRPSTASAVLLNTLRYANHDTWQTLARSKTVSSTIWARFRIRHGT